MEVHIEGLTSKTITLDSDGDVKAEGLTDYVSPEALRLLAKIGRALRQYRDQTDG